ncbi:lipopolysaccharide biosynthesis protein [Rubripirellula reticaptiva]|uniref:Polysaccharide biosynthesis protein n=1 Tax=Rubripirellula reticaptiva TaxID=2528013 RepID=A0A5C6EHU3_9BACT|nr:oligosaccharide flippase family protein [Rubripirellula reticaptiva]TWU48110.1 Polysaccharide biosynthesis protein [Rubripirellula reticaptiva]
MNRRPGPKRGKLSNLVATGRSAISKGSGAREHLTDSVILAIGYVAQLILQMGYFLILTRMLGAERFGQFAAALAAINLVSPFAGIGYSEVALIRVSQDREETGLWLANSVVATLALGIPLAIALALICSQTGSGNLIEWHLMLGLAICELALVRACLAIARIRQARREIKGTSAINVSVSATKAIVAMLLWMSGNDSLLMLVIILDICFTPVLLYFFVSLARQSSATQVSWTALRSNFKLALSFTTGVFSKAVYTDMDKLFLARWTTSEIVGTYAAGYKILSLAFLPIRAILEATFPKQVAYAAKSPSDCLKFSSRVLGVNLLIACCLSACIYLLAPWATVLLGEDFNDSVDVLRVGCVLPILQVLHYSMGNYLSAIGRQTFRATAQVTVVIAYVAVAWFLIPRYSWHGAIWTSLSCEFLLVLLLSTGCFASFFRDDPPTPQTLSEQGEA